MNYKLIILAPSCGGKSSLMRYFRENTDLHIAETDEEVMKANGDIWPDDKLKNETLVPKTTREIITRENVIYFASFIPPELLIEARARGFKIGVLEVPIEELRKRNIQRMEVEGYDDVSQWFEAQLNGFKVLRKMGIVDFSLDANQDIGKVAQAIQDSLE